MEVDTKERACVLIYKRYKNLSVYKNNCNHKIFFTTVDEFDDRTPVEFISICSAFD